MESPLIVREQLGSLVIIRAFHLSVESPIAFLLFLLIIIIFPPSKKIFVSRLIERLYSSSYRTSREMINYHPTSLTFDPLRSYWTLHKNHCYHYSSLSVSAMCIRPFLFNRGHLEKFIGILYKRIQWSFKTVIAPYF